MTNLLEQLIAIPSISREEKAVADFLQDRLQDLHPRRHGNNLWMVKGEGPVLLLDAHIDTVKPVAGWVRDPFAPTWEEDRIYGVQIYMSDRDGATKEDILASHGVLSMDPVTQILTVTLYDALVEKVEGTGKDRRKEHAYSESVELRVPFGDQYNRKDVTIKDKYLPYKGLFARLAIYIQRGKDAAGVDATAITVEINQRIALALAPIAFMMLGMPLAIRTSRRETSIGLILSVALGALYYGGVLVSDALRNNPHLYPQYVVWIPPLLFQLFGVVYLTKIARK